MSHDATNWAIKQHGIKPALKVVLWNLCDRYHPDNGCFPSQETLAADWEVSRSALNTHLDELEARGLIAREQQRARGTNRMERTRYSFAFEADFVARKTETPSPESGQ
ncbi:helix-turn-helix domain-containing protein [Rhizobium leguminosarum]|uniref:helix-turn-helix domain-containing protein n=1 Tax=Rhizobium leguminosarum TaxID=384 RepID=UPI0013DACBD9|nr:helix-turn-helix domain-containing protein [Rhizobium leguminosarum]NEK39336.1 GntR family transcriptional regulator [Rhizobium leguminosarum]